MYIFSPFSEIRIASGSAMISDLLSLSPSEAGVTAPLLFGVLALGGAAVDEEWFGIWLLAGGIPGPDWLWFWLHSLVSTMVSSRWSPSWVTLCTWIRCFSMCGFSVKLSWQRGQWSLGCWEWLVEMCACSRSSLTVLKLQKLQVRICSLPSIASAIYKHTTFN